MNSGEFLSIGLITSGGEESDQYVTLLQQSGVKLQKSISPSEIGNAEISQTDLHVWLLDIEDEDWTDPLDDLLDQSSVPVFFHERGSLSKQTHPDYWVEKQIDRLYEMAGLTPPGESNKEQASDQPQTDASDSSAESVSLETDDSVDRLDLATEQLAETIQDLAEIGETNPKDLAEPIQEVADELSQDLDFDAADFDLDSELNVESDLSGDFLDSEKQDDSKDSKTVEASDLSLIDEDDKSDRQRTRQDKEQARSIESEVTSSSDEFTLDDDATDNISFDVERYDDDMENFESELDSFLNDAKSSESTDQTNPPEQVDAIPESSVTKDEALPQAFEPQDESPSKQTLTDDKPEPFFESPESFEMDETSAQSKDEDFSDFDFEGGEDIDFGLPEESHELSAENDEANKSQVAESAVTDSDTSEIELEVPLEFGDTEALSETDGNKADLSSGRTADTVGISLDDATDDHFLSSDEHSDNEELQESLNLEFDLETVDEPEAQSETPRSDTQNEESTINTPDWTLEEDVNDSNESAASFELPESDSPTLEQPIEDDEFSIDIDDQELEQFADDDTSSPEGTSEEFEVELTEFGEQVAEQEGAAESIELDNSDFELQESQESEKQQEPASGDSTFGDAYPPDLPDDELEWESLSAEKEEHGELFESEPLLEPDSDLSAADEAELDDVVLSEFESDNDELDDEVSEADIPLLDDTAADMQFEFVEEEQEPEVIIPDQKLWVLGASLGGPAAVKRFLQALPTKIDCAFVLAQHIDDSFLPVLCNILDSQTPFKAIIVDQKMKVESGCVYIAPIQNKIVFDEEGFVDVQLEKWTPPYAPCIDDVVTEAGSVFQHNCGVIIFSGMGNDGSVGVEQVINSGVTIWAQSPDSCANSSMPDSVMEQERAAYIGNPEELASQLVEFIESAQVKSA